MSEQLIHHGRARLNDRPNLMPIHDSVTLVPGGRPAARSSRRDRTPASGETATSTANELLSRSWPASTGPVGHHLQRDQHDAAVRLADAAARYVDALHMAAEDLAGREVVEALNAAAEQIVPGLTDEPAWPTLRAHLLLLAAHGTDPVAQLATAAGSRELNSADDRAAVLDWRLDDTGHRNAGQGPLPWLPGIPQGLRDHPVWGNYLAARSDLVRTLADQVEATVADTDPPAWVTQRGTVLPSSVIGDVQVWRAAMQVSPEDRRPTGPVQLQKAARTWQQHLDRQVAGDRAPALQEWGWLLNQLSPNLTKDPFAPMLADRLAAISRAGVDAWQLLCSAITTGGPLPDDHAAAAVWWRISRQLTPTVTAQADTGHTFATVRSARLTELIGADQADTLQSSRRWLPLITAVDHALQRGWRLDDILGAAVIPDDGSVDAAQALVWRISLLADPRPTDEPGEPLSIAAPPDPRPNTEPPLETKRLTEAAPITPEQRWAALASQLDQRLLRQRDWPALAQLMQRVDDQGHDVAAITRALTRTPLNDLPAQDLRYRLAAHLDLGDDLPQPPVHTSTAKTTTRPRRHREAAASFMATTRTPPR